MSLLLESLFPGICEQTRGYGRCSTTIVCNSLYLALDALRMRFGDLIREIDHEQAELFGPPDRVDEELRYESLSEPHQVLGSLTLAHASLTLADCNCDSLWCQTYRIQLHHMPILAVIQAPLDHAKSVHEPPLLHLRLECILQQLTCFNMALTARAQTKNNLYEPV